MREVAPQGVGVLQEESQDVQPVVSPASRVECEVDGVRDKYGFEDALVHRGALVAQQASVYASSAAACVPDDFAGHVHVGVVLCGVVELSACLAEGSLGVG